MRRCLDRVELTLTLAALACAGLLQNIDLNNRDCQALILAPTRELASQIVKVVMAIGDYLGVSTMVRATPRTPGRPAPPPRSRRLAPVGPALAARGNPGLVAPLRRRVSAGTAQGATGTHARAHAPTALHRAVAPDQLRQRGCDARAPLRPTLRSLRGADEALARDPCLPLHARPALVARTCARTWTSCAPASSSSSVRDP